MRYVQVGVKINKSPHSASSASQCGHGAFSDHRIVNDILGFVSGFAHLSGLPIRWLTSSNASTTLLCCEKTLHTLLWTPYFSWKISHHRHHCNHASMERDEVYVPKTRADLGIPDLPSHEIDWNEIFGDTPIYTLFLLIRQQLLAFPAYLCEFIIDMLSFL